MLTVPVLWPIQLNDDQPTQSLKIQIAQRIADIEKPRTPAFDVKPLIGAISRR